MESAVAQSKPVDVSDSLRTEILRELRAELQTELRQFNLTQQPSRTQWLSDIDDALELYAADWTRRVDFAAFATGGRVLSTSGSFRAKVRHFLPSRFQFLPVFVFLWDTVARFDLAAVSSSQLVRGRVCARV